MRFTIENDRLLQDGKPVDFVQTQMHGGRIPPELIVMHDTAGSPAEGAIHWVTKGRARGKISAHLGIDRDGAVTQPLEFDRKAWHAGPLK